MFRSAPQGNKYDYLVSGCKPFAVLFCLCFFFSAHAQNELPHPDLQKPLDTLPLRHIDTAAIKPKASKLLNIINHIVFGFKIGPGRLITLPVFEYSPETSVGLGLSSTYLFRFSKADSNSLVSTVGMDLLFTVRGQMIVEPHWNFVGKHGRYRSTGDIGFRVYPDYYYSIGNSVNNDTKQKYQSKYVFIRANFTPRVAKNYYLGVQYGFEDMYYLMPIRQGLWDSSSVPGGNGYRSSGAGLKTFYDSRDNSYFPFKGTFLSLSNVFYSKVFGSNQYFNNVTLDIRQFFNPYRSHVIALQGYAEFNPGFKGSTPPFRMMSTLGGADLMRGYYRWQYRDINVMAIQVEYRFPLIWRLIGTVFGSTGDVFNKPSDLSWKLLKVSGGAGLRFTLDAKERVNLRLDCAWARFNGTGVPAFYFSLGEAF